MGRQGENEWIYSEFGVNTLNLQQVSEVDVKSGSWSIKLRQSLRWVAFAEKYSPPILLLKEFRKSLRSQCFLPTKLWVSRCFNLLSWKSNRLKGFRPGCCQNDLSISFKVFQRTLTQHKVMALNRYWLTKLKALPRQDCHGEPPAHVEPWKFPPFGEDQEQWHEVHNRSGLAGWCSWEMSLPGGLRLRPRSVNQIGPISTWLQFFLDFDRTRRIKQHHSLNPSSPKCKANGGSLWAFFGKNNGGTVWWLRHPNSDVYWSKIELKRSWNDQIAMVAMIFSKSPNYSHSTTIFRPNQRTVSTSFFSAGGVRSIFTFAGRFHVCFLRMEHLSSRNATFTGAPPVATELMVQDHVQDMVHLSHKQSSPQKKETNNPWNTCFRRFPTMG